MFHSQHMNILKLFGIVAGVIASLLGASGAAFASAHETSTTGAAHKHRPGHPTASASPSSHGATTTTWRSGS